MSFNLVNGWRGRGRLPVDLFALILAAHGIEQLDIKRIAAMGQQLSDDELLQSSELLDDVLHNALVLSWEIQDNFFEPEEEEGVGEEEEKEVVSTPEDNERENNHHYHLHHHRRHGHQVVSAHVVSDTSSGSVCEASFPSTLPTSEPPRLPEAPPSSYRQIPGFHQFRREQAKRRHHGPIWARRGQHAPSVLTINHMKVEPWEQQLFIGRDELHSVPCKQTVNRSSWILCYTFANMLT